MANKTIDGILVRIGGDYDLDKDLNRAKRSTAATAKVIDKETSKMGKSFERMGKRAKTAGKFLLTGMLLSLIPLSIHFKNAARDAEEMESKFAAVFKELTAATKRWAEETATATNRSRFALMDYASGLQDLFVPMGFARKEAAEMSKRLVQLAIDVSSFNNVAEKDVLLNFKSGIVGSSEALRKFGINTKDTAVQQEILNQGWAKSKKEITENMKVMGRMAIILRETGDAHGDAARTAGSQANQEKLLAARSEELSIKFGQALAPATVKVTEALIGMTEVMNDLFDIGGPVLTGLDLEFDDLAKKSQDLGQKLLELKQMENDPISFKTIFGALGGAFENDAIAKIEKQLKDLGIEAETVLDKIKSRDAVNAEKDAKSLAASAEVERIKAEEEAAAKLKKSLAEMQVIIDKITTTNIQNQNSVFENIQFNLNREVAAFEKANKDKVGFEQLFADFKKARGEQASQEFDAELIRQAKITKETTENMADQVDSQRNSALMAQGDVISVINATAEAELLAFQRAFEGKVGYEAAYLAFKISTEEKRVAAVENANNQLIEGVSELTAAEREFANVIDRSFEDAIFQGKNLGDVIDNLIKQMAKIVIQRAILDKVSDKIGGALGGIFNFANGGVMSSGGALPLNSYAGGGVATSPQMAIFGEGKNNEAFVPLPDNKTIPVTLTGGGGGQGGDNNITIINHNTFEAPLADTVAAVWSMAQPIIDVKMRDSIEQAVNGVRR